MEDFFVSSPTTSRAVKLTSSSGCPKLCLLCVLYLGCNYTDFSYPDLKMLLPDGLKDIQSVTSLHFWPVSVLSVHPLALAMIAPFSFHLPSELNRISVFRQPCRTFTWRAFIPFMERSELNLLT